MTEELSVRKLNIPPSGDGSSSSVKIGRSSDCKIFEVVGVGECERKTFRRVEGGGSDSGTIEVVGGGECEKLNF